MTAVFGACGCRDSQVPIAKSPTATSTARIDSSSSETAAVTVCLGGSKIDDAGLLQRLKGLSRIDELHLFGTQITNDGLCIWKG